MSSVDTQWFPVSLWVVLTALGCGGGVSAVDAGDQDGAASSPGPNDDGAPCRVTSEAARCDTEAVEMLDATGSDLRRVYWARPSLTAPAEGYPAVLLYQGSIYGPALSWDTDLSIDTAFGGYYQVALIDALLQDGFVVIQPEASGGRVWTTNAGGDYEAGVDAEFIPLLLARVEDGTFGPVDMERIYATGISSGGYMTSRMAVSYPGRFRALAIHSAAYASCLGPLCSIPAQLPTEHPPTLLLHGALDTTVPIATARAYEERLQQSGIETRFVEDPAAGHAWLEVSPREITDWFLTH